MYIKLHYTTTNINIYLNYVHGFCIVQSFKFVYEIKIEKYLVKLFAMFDIFLILLIFYIYYLQSTYYYFLILIEQF